MFTQIIEAVIAGVFTFALAVLFYISSKEDKRKWLTLTLFMKAQIMVEEPLIQDQLKPKQAEQKQLSFKEKKPELTQEQQHQ
jgi:hypothetical protein